MSLDRSWITSLVLFVCVSFGNDTEASLEVSQTYASVKDAVHAAVNRYNPVSIEDDREYIGAVMTEGSGFVYTVQASAAGANRVSFKLPASEWGRVRALWHTHGDDSPSHRYFSEVDTRTANSLDLPFYMADYTGYLRVFQPGDKTLRRDSALRLGLPHRGGFALGSVVSNSTNQPLRVHTDLAQLAC